MSENEKEKILSLFKDCVFDGILTEYDYEDKILYYLPDDLEYEVESGATKVVLILPNFNYVIKIPFTGFYESFYNEKRENWEDEYCEFSGASVENCWDYCLCECERYEIAKENKLEKYFAKTIYLDSINEHPIYIQEKAVIYDSIYPKKKISKKEEEKTRKKCFEQQISCFNINWLADLLKYCGNKEFENFLFFIRINGFNDDLHCGNIGYIKNRPVLVDYSGFNS